MNTISIDWDVGVRCLMHDFVAAAAGGVCVCGEAVHQELLGHPAVRHQLSTANISQHHQ